MENASKFLITAAEILIGILLLSILVFAFYFWGDFSRGVDKNIKDNEINEFNSKFHVYNGRTNLTAHDIVTIVSLANDYNQDMEDASYKIKIEGNVLTEGNINTTTNITTFMSKIPTFIRKQHKL